MQRVGQKDTSPEMAVRRLIFASGYRYRLHQRDLPGCPDIVFLKRKKVIFVHGCFWHRHVGCKRAAMPNTNQDFWRLKFAKTIERDAKIISALRELGWDSLVIWECELKIPDILLKRIKSFLS
ncbi:very short patch repair endonuclease [Burkholderia multivorans]|nr:very short patch repair endonuclease [Burkholderia multivorans]PRH33451.1 very short patch repair endonuclease [Burkholderia multivorans]